MKKQNLKKLKVNVFQVTKLQPTQMMVLKGGAVTASATKSTITICPIK